VFVAVAMDVGGVPAAKPIYEAAKASYVTLVDPQNQLGEALGFKVIPNGFFIDEAGVIRGRQIGGFEVSSPRTIKAVEEFLALPRVTPGVPKIESEPDRLRRLEQSASKEPGQGSHRLEYGKALLRSEAPAKALSELQAAVRLLPESSSARFNLGTALLALERKDEALVEFDHALKLDRENYIVRKQIWLIRYPERFHPTIDWTWQREQLKKEREQEAKDGSESTALSADVR
jgi:tetratricopeptide (TPR) repeat protein